MRTRTWLSAGLLAVGCLPLGGCPQRLRIPVTFELGEGLGRFVITAGETQKNPGTANLGDTNFSPSNGTLTINPENITITPTDGGGGKRADHLQGGTLIIIARIAAVEGLATVCDDGEEYGPFSVELDADNQPVSVDPASVTLSGNTIDLINLGSFSLCIEVTSPIDGTITIEALNFSFGL